MIGLRITRAIICAAVTGLCVWIASIAPHPFMLLATAFVVGGVTDGLFGKISAEARAAWLDLRRRGPR